MRVTWLADVLRAADLYVVEEPGWRGRGKDFPGALEGVVGHHTVSSPSQNCPSINIVTNGRPDLNGPLAQIVLCRDGVIHAIADGVANHAGDGNWPGINLGNKDTIGIEAENNGTGEPWPEHQMDVYVRMVAALLEHINRGPERFCTHYEWREPQGYKIDPYGEWVDQQGQDWYDGKSSAASASADTFRSQVEDAMAGGMTPEQEAKLDQVLNLCDNILRPKLDSVYVEVYDEDHPDTLGGRVKLMEDKINQVYRQVEGDDRTDTLGGRIFALVEADEHKRLRGDHDDDPTHAVDPNRAAADAAKRQGRDDDE